MISLLKYRASALKFLSFNYLCVMIPIFEIIADGKMNRIQHEIKDI